MRSFSKMFTALSLVALATTPVYADEAPKAPPKKPAASAGKAEPSQSNGHCMQGSDKSMHDQKMKGRAGKKGKGKMGGMGKMECAGMDGKMKPMGTPKPSDKPATEHDHK